MGRMRHTGPGTMATVPLSLPTPAYGPLTWCGSSDKHGSLRRDRTTESKEPDKSLGFPSGVSQTSRDELSSFNLCKQVPSMRIMLVLGLASSEYLLGAVWSPGDNIGLVRSYAPARAPRTSPTAILNHSPSASMPQVSHSQGALTICVVCSATPLCPADAVCHLSNMPRSRRKVTWSPSPQVLK